MAPPGGRRASLGTVLGACSAVVGLLIGLGPLGDNSFFTHLATGRLILADGRVPTVDPYSFTGSGRPWVVQSWLASVVFAGLEQVGGFGAIRLAIGAAAAGLGWAAWRLCRPARSAVGRIALVSLALGIGSEHWVERPLIFGLLGLALLLVAADDGFDARWLVPVMWIWVNSHGSFPIGLLALAAMAVGRRLDGQRPVAELRALRWAGLGTALAVVNPLGVRILTFPLTVLERGEAFAQIVEWQPPNFDSVGSKLFLVQVAAAVLLLVRRPAYRFALPMVVLVAMALLASRNIPQASLVLLPGMAAGIGRLGSIDLARRARVFALATIVAVLGGAVLAAATLAGPSVSDEGYPVDALAWLAERDQVDPEVRLVSRDYVGNYLEARHGPDRVQVFMDDRVDMYPTGVVADYAVLRAGGRGWDEALERARADVVVWNVDEPLTQLIEASPDWRLVYTDDEWVVAVPAGSSVLPGTELERRR